MKFTRIPSLVDTALVKTATVLWNQPDICQLINLHVLRSHYTPYPHLQYVAAKVIEKVRQLPLPKRLKQQLIDFIKPIGDEIKKWVYYHSQICIDLSLCWPFKLYWTGKGTVDGRKMAEILIKHKSLHITTRYILACLYCLESDIIELWNAMPQDGRNMFYSEKYPQNIRQLKLVVFWTYYLKGEATKLADMSKSRWHRRKSPYQYAFECAALENNKVAVSYFLPKLSYRERDQSLLKCARRLSEIICTGDEGRYSDLEVDMIVFFLAQMNEDQQVRVYKLWNEKVLMEFLFWPLQSFFVEIVKGMRNSILGQVGFYMLAEMMAERMILTDYNYQKMFMQFWQNIPDPYRRSFLDYEDGQISLTKIFQTGNKILINMVLNDASPEIKKKLIFSEVGMCICTPLILEGNWSLLELFIVECRLTKVEMMILQRRFQDSAKEDTSKESIKRWVEFLQRFESNIFT